MNPPPGEYTVPEESFSGSGQIKKMRDIEFGEESEYEVEIEEGAEGVVPLNPPIITQSEQLNPTWRDPSEKIP